MFIGLIIGGSIGFGFGKKWSSIKSFKLMPWIDSKIKKEEDKEDK